MAQSTTATRTETRESFDAVIIGSGFGGSVMAYQLAKQGLSVCVLERGRAYPPGSFARTPKQMGKNFWDPSEDYFGLFDLWSFRHAEMVCASGLGGGSLIYANVLLRKDEDWFVKKGTEDQGPEYWPLTRQDLDPHYDEVENVLDPATYPIDHEPYSETPKTKAFMLAGKAVSHEAELAPLAITFGNDPDEPVPGQQIPGAPNIHGERGTRYTCRLTGECDLGCNWGSKNTLDFNYLTMAANAGAEIRTRCEVEEFAPRGGHGENGWTVTYVNRIGHDEDPSKPGHWKPRENGEKRRVKIEAKGVVLAAGCLGTTFLMLKMQERRALQGLSPKLGTRFSGGGDFLSFAARCRDWQGDTLVPHTIDPTYGPVITSYMRYPDRLEDPENKEIHNRGFYLEDGGFPNFAAWGIEIANTPGMARRAAVVAWQMLRHRLSGTPRSTIGAEAARFVGEAEYSGGTLPILAMGRDYPDGTMKLSKKGFLELDWRRKKSDEYFTDVREASSYVATALAARDFKISFSWYLRRLLTVHPLGGCPMGDSKEDGVVDPWGRVFGYENLYLADASVMPGPVGPNPSLTIAALAHRFAGVAAKELLPDGAAPPPSVEVGVEVDGAGPGGRFTRVPPDATAPVGADEVEEEPPVEVAFAEELDGFVTFGDSDDFDQGFKQGRREGNAIGFHLEVEIENLARFLDDPKHWARVNGYVRAAHFGGDCAISDGWINLFALVGDPPMKQLLYELPFQDTKGNPFILRGHKEIKDDFGLDLWHDTTTLFTQIVARNPVTGKDANRIAYGILHISVRAFIEELQTFRSSDDLSGLARFGRFFFGELADTYGTHVLGLLGGSR